MSSEISFLQLIRMPRKGPSSQWDSSLQITEKKLSKILLIRFQINLIPKLRTSYSLFMFSYLPDKMMNIGWVACNFDLGIYFLNINRQGNILYLHGHSVFYWVKIKYMYKYQNTSKYASLYLNCIIFYQTFDYAPVLTLIHDFVVFVEFRV